MTKSDFRWEIIQDYREKTFRYNANRRIRNTEEAVRFVNDRGFIFFWPVKGILMPSLWGAAAGNRPVPNNHDDPGHVTWRWKDDLLDKRRWFYAKILRGKSTIISMELLPYFYVLSPNFGNPSDDLLIDFQDGRISMEQKLIFNALEKEGQLDTINLRKVTGYSSQERTYLFSRALLELQRDFRILPVGISESGSWNYSYLYDLFHRYHPDFIENSKRITESDARRKILLTYFKSVGYASIRMLKKIFKWSMFDLQNGINFLIKKGFIEGLYNKASDKDGYIITNII